MVEFYIYTCVFENGVPAQTTCSVDPDVARYGLKTHGFLEHGVMVSAYKSRGFGTYGRPHWVAIVGSVKHGRLELRTIREVDAAENRLTELRHRILKRKTLTGATLRWRWKSLVCEGVDVHGLARDRKSVV